MKRASAQLPGWPLLLALLLSAPAACGPRGATTLHHPRPLGGLMIRCVPDDAQVFVDDRFVGTARGMEGAPLSLEVGRHRVEIRRDGCFPHYAEIEVVRGVRQTLQVKLREEPF